MSHKTLYIDIDEEITSIVDRVRKAQAFEIIIVAPKRALLLQSLVNLKLLKKETDRRKKRVMIVTQDRIGKKLIEKAGIMVQGKIDDSMVENSEEVEEYVSSDDGAKLNNEITEGLSDEKDQLMIGSDEYFDDPADEKGEVSNNIGEISFGEKKELELEKEQEASGGKAEKKEKEKRGVRISDIVAGPKSKTRKTENKFARMPAKKNENNGSKSNAFHRQKDIQVKLSDKADKYFSGIPGSSPVTARREEKIIKTERVKGKPIRYFVFFTMVFVILGIFAGVYFYLPKANLVIYLTDQEESISLNVEANTEASSVEKDKKIIPAALEQIEKEQTSEFEATGSKTGAGKSGGKVVIYNEFSGDNQPLVATTRLETSDGKIFRITKNIVVPGMTKIGTEIKPGAIETDVVADKPGAEYNLGPENFKITGFKGGPKYEKFYAKSTKEMTGGSEGETSIISSQDITDAKEKLISDSKREAVREMVESVPSGRKIFEDTIVAEVENTSASAIVGAQAEKFSYTVKVKAKTLSFSEEDIKNILTDSLGQEGDGGDGAIFNKSLNYILAEEDIEKGFARFEVKTDLSFLSDVDSANFKRGILGKNSDEIQVIAKSYPAIRKVDISFWPFFVSRVPLSEKRVNIEMK
jgi:hypothetical protein